LDPSPQAPSQICFSPGIRALTSLTDLKIDVINHFLETGRDQHRQEPGSVMSVSFHINKQPWLALNSRPKEMAMTEAVSFQVICDSQAEIDYYWGKLTEGISEEDAKRQICGWLRDRFGVSWQIVPKLVAEAMSSGNEKKISATMEAFMKMSKIIVKDVEEALAAVEGK
jgi:predicted 3-demethylubiquinone-9 3-methyltransferase (glyoxalase superfamily)